MDAVCPGGRKDYVIIILGAWLISRPSRAFGAICPYYPEKRLLGIGLILPLSFQDRASPSPITHQPQDSRA
jgi:hypothetical protein